MIKLKQPVNLVIETEEELRAIWHKLNNSNISDYIKIFPHAKTEMFNYYSLWDKLKPLLKNNNIDPRKPMKQPLKIGEYEVIFNADKSISVGCQKVTLEQLEDIMRVIASNHKIAFQINPE